MKIIFTILLQIYLHFGLYNFKIHGGNSNGYPRNGDSFWPVTGPSSHHHRYMYRLAQVPTLGHRLIKNGYRAIKTAVTSGTKQKSRMGRGIVPDS